MLVDHIFGGHVYVISSFGVAKNPIFKDEDDIRFFQSNIQKYLGEICEIKAYRHQCNQFEYLIRIKEREIVSQFYLKKQAQKRKRKKLDTSEVPLVPETYLIFSQQFSNCLNSYSKKFNFRHQRTGGLFARRYQKYLVESEAEQSDWVTRLNRNEKTSIFSYDWRVKDTLEMPRDSYLRCSIKYYKEIEGARNYSGNVCFDDMVVIENSDLRGCFLCLPPSSIKAPNLAELWKNYFLKIGNAPPW